jgi:hypothetical protein
MQILRNQGQQAYADELVVPMANALMAKARSANMLFLFSCGILFTPVLVIPAGICYYESAVII